MVKAISEAGNDSCTQSGTLESMMVHLTKAGTWETCEQAEICTASIFHIPDTTPAAMQSMPREILFEVLEAIQPPTRIGEGIMFGASIKIWENAAGKKHREYDLPAMIWQTGVYGWYNAGRRHRVGGPAVIRPSGQTEWWIDGKSVSPQGLEAADQLPQMPKILQ